MDTLHHTTTLTAQDSWHPPRDGWSSVHGHSDVLPNILTPRSHAPERRRPPAHSILTVSEHGHARTVRRQARARPTNRPLVRTRAQLHKRRTDHGKGAPCNNHGATFPRASGALTSTPSPPELSNARAGRRVASFCQPGCSQKNAPRPPERTLLLHNVRYKPCPNLARSQSLTMAHNAHYANQRARFASAQLRLSRPTACWL
jgi:hypothetical protein